MNFFYRFNIFCFVFIVFGIATIHANKICIYQESLVENEGFGNCAMKDSGELEILKAFIKPNDIVFDVGAFEGEWSTFVATSKTGVKVYAFEPNNESYKNLIHNIKKYKNIKGFRCAISDKLGRFPFIFYKDNRTHHTVPRCRESSFYRSKIVESRPWISFDIINKQTESIEEFCLRNNIEKINFLKIDTCGSELDVFKGANNMIKLHQIDIIQFNYDEKYQEIGGTFKKIFTLLSKNGYQICRILPQGLAYIAKWDNKYENYRYANYIAITNRII